MARILTEESSLRRRHAAAQTEHRVLDRLRYVEWPLAGLLLLGGGVWYVLKGSWSLLAAGGMALFLCVGHLLKMRENREEQRIIEIGRRGESDMSRLLARALPASYYLLNDVLLKAGAVSAQMDHVLVGPNGLFILETKKWSGRLEGDEREKTWTHYRRADTTPRQVGNPVLQVQRQLAVMQDVLRRARLDWPDVHALLVRASRSPLAMAIRNQTRDFMTPEAAVDFIRKATPQKTYAEETINQALRCLGIR